MYTAAIHLVNHEMTIQKPLSETASDETATTKSSPGPLLHEAAKNGDIRSLRKTLRSGSELDVNELDDEDRTALHYASNSLIAEKLINAGAVIDIEDAEGCTPLHRAVAERRLDVVWLLLTHNARTDTRDDEGKTPMAHAHGCPPAESMLRHGTSTALLRAVEADRADIVEALIGAGADKEVRNEKGFVALIVATIQGSWNAARVLIEHGADTDVYGDMGNGVIHMAAHRGPADFMGFLLDRGLPINYQNHWGGTPLLEAAERDGRDEVIALLLERGADPAPRNNAGYTPLGLASKAGKTKVVKMILDRMKGRELLSPRTRSDHGPAGWAPLAEASHHAHPECVRLLLEAGSEVNVGNHDNTPLHLLLWPTDAVRTVADRVEVMRLLLEAGASLDAKGPSEITPLAAACRWGSLPLVQLLIDAGADVDSLSWAGEGSEKEFGYTNLMLSVAFGGDDNLDVVTALIKAGAEVNKRTYGTKKLNAAEMAQNRGRMDIVNILEDAGAIPDKPRNTSVGRGRR